MNDHVFMKDRPNIQDVRQAMRRIEPHVHRTPVARCRTIEEHVGCEVHMKCENLQKVGAFKFRGVRNHQTQPRRTRLHIVHEF